MGILRRILHALFGHAFYEFGVYTAEEIGRPKGIIILVCRHCGVRKSYVGSCTVWDCVQDGRRPGSGIERLLSDLYAHRKLVRDKKVMEIATGDGG